MTTNTPEHVVAFRSTLRSRAAWFLRCLVQSLFAAGCVSIPMLLSQALSGRPATWGDGRGVSLLGARPLSGEDPWFWCLVIAIAALIVWGARALTVRLIPKLSWIVSSPSRWSRQIESVLLFFFGGAAGALTWFVYWSATASDVNNAVSNMILPLFVLAIGILFAGSASGKGKRER